MKRKRYYVKKKKSRSKQVQTTVHKERFLVESSSDSDNKTSCFPFFRKSRYRNVSKPKHGNKLINTPRAFECSDLEPHPSLRKIFTNSPPSSRTPKDQDKTEYFSDEEEEVDEEDSDVEEDIGSYERVKRAMQIYEEKKALKKKQEAEYALFPHKAPPLPKGPPWDDSDDDPAAYRPTMVPCASVEEDEDGEGEQREEAAAAAAAPAVAAPAATAPAAVGPERWARLHRHSHQRRREGDARPRSPGPSPGPGPSGEAGEAGLEARRPRSHGHSADPRAF